MYKCKEKNKTVFSSFACWTWKHRQRTANVKDILFVRWSSCEPPYLRLIKRFIFSHNVLNFIDGIVSLFFCKRTLLLEQANVNMSFDVVFLVQDLHVVATEKDVDNALKNEPSFSAVVCYTSLVCGSLEPQCHTYGFPFSRASTSDFCDASRL